MANCNGNCSGCGGGGPAAGSLSITPQELAFLRQLARIPFLPVARKLGEADPVYLEEGQARQAEMSLLLQMLEKKGLISLDYDKPLKGWDMSAYEAYPIQGSMALTNRGQKVLELLDLQGIDEELGRENSWTVHRRKTNRHPGKTFFRENEKNT